MKTSPRHRFRLYVAGESPHSATARRNLRELCAQCLADDYEIECIDVLVDPARALRDGVFITPTVVRVAPQPSRPVIGNLSQRETVLNALGLLPIAS